VSWILPILVRVFGYMKGGKEADTKFEDALAAVRVFLIVYAYLLQLKYVCVHSLLSGHSFFLLITGCTNWKSPT